MGWFIDFIFGAWTIAVVVLIVHLFSTVNALARGNYRRNYANEMEPAFIPARMYFYSIVVLSLVYAVITGLPELGAIVRLFIYYHIDS